MSLAAELWEANADLAEAARTSAFVRGVADGGLPLPVFRHYVTQDAYFLEAFARAYALALAHSTGRAALETFASLLAGVLDELRLHASYAERWGTDPSATEPADATLAYTDFLLATAALGDVGLTCAAMTPCMRLYAFLGQALAEAGGHEDSPYAEWVTTYADPAFEDLAVRLEALLDEAPDGPRLRAAYRRAMRLEVAFFAAAVHGGTT